MKKLLGGLKDLIMRHKILSMICLLAFIIIVVLLYVFFSIFIGGNNKFCKNISLLKRIILYPLSYMVNPFHHNNLL